MEENTATVEVRLRSSKTEKRLGLTSRGWIILGVAVIVIFLEFAPRFGFIESYSMPPLTTMVLRAGQLLVTPEFLVHDLVPTLIAILVCFVLASVLGIAVGFVLWHFPAVSRVVEPWLAVYYAIPTFALYPLLVVIAGVGLAPIILLGTLLSIVAVITSTVDGLRATPPLVLRLCDSLELSAWHRTVRIYLPSAIEQISVGLRLALSYSVIGVLASEFILSTQGLGYFISNAGEHFQIADMYAGIVLVLLLALGVNLGMSSLLNKRRRRITGVV